jgi:hypothetical protein
MFCRMTYIHEADTLRHPALVIPTMCTFGRKGDSSFDTSPGLSMLNLEM